ncbi:MAG: hypothetical protein Q8Q09_16895 [Deltaproteobacteria bacterium]|nr:hypothetical protein [Deltaproteobacteria bacterium]
MIPRPTAPAPTEPSPHPATSPGTLARCTLALPAALRVDSPALRALPARIPLALAPALASLLGLLVATRHDVPARAFAPNFVALALALPALVALTLSPARARPALARTLPWLAVCALLATLLSPGTEGIHRWIDLRVFRLHVSAALGPLLLIGLVVPSRAGLCAMVLAQCVHLAQPDRAQSLWLALASLPLLLDRRRFARPIGLAASATLLALALATWQRTDPLAPVAHVERIVALAVQSGPPWALLMASTALALWAAAVHQARETTDPTAPRWVTLSVLSWLALPSLTVAPMPLFGAGAGPMFGWFSTLSVLTLWPTPAAPGDVAGSPVKPSDV